MLRIVLDFVCLGVSPAGSAFEGAFQESSPCRLKAQPWKEAGRIFRSDPHWPGGDGAASVDLGHGRVLWLFGDSFVDLSGSGVRRTSDSKNQDQGCYEETITSRWGDLEAE